MDRRIHKVNPSTLPLRASVASPVQKPETPASDSSAAGVFVSGGVTTPADQARDRVTPAPLSVQIQYPEFAAFVAAMRSTFGDDLQATLRKREPVRWLRCEGCKRVFTVPGRPEDIQGVAGVSCTCGRVVGLNGHRWIGFSPLLRPQQNKSRFLVTPGFSPVGWIGEGS